MEAANKDSSYQTRELYVKIGTLGKRGYAFGHQDTTAYGVGWRNHGDGYRSDINDVVGDFPGVHGFDLGHLELGAAKNLDQVGFGPMAQLMALAHERGGIVAISWHANNPVTLGDSWDTTPAVRHILKDGSLHARYREWLQNLAHFIKSLKDPSGNYIPVVFRPFHEMNGAWFWWGKNSCSPTEYKQLWKETFEIMTQELLVHNILFAYSPNTLERPEDYLKYYPGDQYVDILGLDSYQHGSHRTFMKLLKKDLWTMRQIAQTKKKPYALTEVGLERVKINDWWTRVFDPCVRGSGIAWALFWRNDRHEHHFAPYLGHGSSDDFREFKKLPHVLFLKEMEAMVP